ncbi:hypothetical protein A5876_001745 [Enterococcus sp. 3C8_DIV0646]|nr:hypothetical protein A5876_001745 [Enterococcus sp. 3C8_DIV0646]
MIRSSFFYKYAKILYELKKITTVFIFLTIIYNFIAMFACFSKRHSIECKRIETKKNRHPVILLAQTYEALISHFSKQDDQSSCHS